jgi:predicted ribosomally synthesized peptide with SipW-like signal peptide
MKSKLAALFAAVMLSLIVTSAAYAAWTATLTINGEVTTGAFSVSIEAEELTDNNGVAEVAETGPSGSVRIVVANAYPGCEGSVRITLNNDGNVPVEITSVGAEPTSSVVEWTFNPSTAPDEGDVIDAHNSMAFDVSWSILEDAPQDTTEIFTVHIGFGLPT